MHVSDDLKASSFNDSVLLASYKVTYRVSKAGKLHTIAENLIFPAALDIVEIMVKLCKPGYSESFVKIWARFIKIFFITQRSGGYPKKVLTRVLELGAELLMFLQNVKSEYASRFSDPIWLLKLAILTDIFSHLNHLNKNLQGREENVLTAKDKVKAFHAKLRLLATSLQNKMIESFPCVQKIVEQTKVLQYQPTFLA
ncbi:Zinc finger BED domain-containing protein 5 [Eumeta japonica]|uniref:Zinc finger BED domain-containing protein 5 n=1 Tax=Eumeta variegata TaxID=151549 RepID=A0A4C1VPV1_EUMVA|nr:Zinc finger BED domain-containing protein 5 [Eumeta japonica]